MTMPEWVKNVDLKQVAMGAIIIFVILAFGYLLGTVKTSQDIVGELTRQVQVQVDAQYKDRLNALQNASESKDKIIFEQSQKIIALDGKFKKLSQEKANVKKPQDSAELGSRLNALGLKPVIR